MRQGVQVQSMTDLNQSIDIHWNDKDGAVQVVRVDDEKVVDKAEDN